MCMQGLQKPDEGTGSLGTGAKDSCESPSVTWELNSGLQQVLLSY